MSILSFALAQVAEETTTSSLPIVGSVILAGRSGVNLKRACCDEIPHTYRAAGEHLINSAVQCGFAIAFLNPVLLATAGAELGVSAITYCRTVLR